MTDTSLVAGARPARRAAVEWPTAALALAIYGGWAAATLLHAEIPLWLLVPLGGWLVAWHSSLQHEIIHGHFTRSAALDRLIGFWPLALWVPYDRYRDTHLLHHQDARLTDPLDDPETRYWTDEAFRRLGAVGRALVRAQATLLGRLTIGPAWAASSFARAELRAIVAGDRAIARAWAWHLLAVAAVLAWLTEVAGMEVGLYVLAFALPGTALMLLRSFAEHRAAADVAARTAVVERTPLFGLLYLHNNLHAAHHASPGLPWYDLPRFYAENRARLLAGNGGLVYRGYADVARRFLLRPHDAPVHPLGRAP